MATDGDLGPQGPLLLERLLLLERQLLAMEDERDAALLEADRLKQLLAKAEDQFGDARLDAEGYRRELLDERNAAREAIALVRDLTARGGFVEDPGSTHFDTCYHHHAACLAHQVRRILGGING